MKKYLLIGLFILIGTNLTALGGVAYNRMGEATAQLTLTERELSLPYNNRAEKENSGISLSINWRTSSRPTTTSSSSNHFSSQDLKITESELNDLGFDAFDVERNSWVESRELYWALEFDGDLYLAELKKAELNYQTAVASYEEQPSDINSRDIRNSKKRLQRERISNSRLFFLEAAGNYDTLADKFSQQQNIIIVKGLAKPYYNKIQNNYHLRLKYLSVRNIMVPLEYTEVLSSLTSNYYIDIIPPRYAVDIKWGSRLEPWIVDAKELIK